MPEGPFGFPRVTNIGPFTTVEAEQEFKRRDTVSDAVPNASGREIGTIHDIDLKEINVVNANLIVRKELPDKEGDILDKIEREVAVATRETNVAKMSYWYDAESGVAKIISIDVKDNFRRMGIATKLKKGELDYMREQGIELVYTDIVSEGGYNLAKKTDFKPITEARFLLDMDVETSLNFSKGMDRGIMFRKL